MIIKAYFRKLNNNFEGYFDENFLIDWLPFSLIWGLDFP